jgi:hypothetical protein
MFGGLGALNGAVSGATCAEAWLKNKLKMTNAAESILCVLSNKFKEFGNQSVSFCVAHMIFA